MVTCKVRVDHYFLPYKSALICFSFTCILTLGIVNVKVYVMTEI